MSMEKEIADISIRQQTVATDCDARKKNTATCEIPPTASAQYRNDQGHSGYYFTVIAAFTPAPNLVLFKEALKVTVCLSAAVKVCFAFHVRVEPLPSESGILR